MQSFSVQGARLDKGLRATNVFQFVATASGGLDAGHLDILTFLSWSLMVTHQHFGNGNPSKNLGNMRQKPRNIGVWRSQPPSQSGIGEGSQRGPGSYVNPTQAINPIT